MPLQKFMCLWLMLGVTASYANPKDFYYQRYLQRQQTQSRTLSGGMPSVHQGSFEQWIDHASPQVGQFKQRYYIDLSFSTQDDDPVFLYICGEAVCQKSALNGAIRNMAKKFHAKLIALEHRYYGKSIPTRGLSTHELRYLTTEAALKDLANFQQQMTKKKGWTGKWVAFGGSYPGSLSAYYRLKYPNLVVGSLASSSPVMAKSNFDEYDAHVAKIAGPSCLAKIRQAVTTIEQTLDKPDQLESIKALFSANTITDKRDFLYVVADIGATAVQYGMKDKFCSMLESGSNAVESYAQFAQYLYASWGIDAISFSAQGAMSENPIDYENGIGLRQWFYQSCKEYGYWQNANPDLKKSARSSLINADYHRNLCQRLFSINEDVHTEVINDNYYLPLQSPSTSHIFFTNGSTDPWSRLSMSHDNANDKNTRLNYFTIKGAAHCDDLRAPKSTDSTDLKKSRKILEQLIASWLQ